MSLTNKRFGALLLCASLLNSANTNIKVSKNLNLPPKKDKVVNSEQKNDLIMEIFKIMSPYFQEEKKQICSGSAHASLDGLEIKGGIGPQSSIGVKWDISQLSKSLGFRKAIYLRKKLAVLSKEVHLSIGHALDYLYFLSKIEALKAKNDTNGIDKVKARINLTKSIMKLRHPTFNFNKLNVLSSKFNTTTPEVKNLKLKFADNPTVPKDISKDRAYRTLNMLNFAVEGKYCYNFDNGGLIGVPAVMSSVSDGQGGMTEMSDDKRGLDEDTGIFLTIKPSEYFNHEHKENELYKHAVHMYESHIKLQDMVEQLSSLKKDEPAYLDLQLQCLKEVSNIHMLNGSFCNS